MMKKRFLSVLAAGLFILTIAGLANAALITIGTATYNGTDYNLIYDADGPLDPVTWLDYSHPQQPWKDQIIWAATLGDKLTVTLNPGYTTSLSWLVGWRLPSAGENPHYGYNQITSEMGHLYYTELGNLGYYDTSGNYQSGYGLNNTGDFDNLNAYWHWSGTEYADGLAGAWYFDVDNGVQGDDYEDCNGYGLAVRSGKVSAVPVPGAIWLFGSGMAGMVALGRRRKGNSV